MWNAAHPQTITHSTHVPVLPSANQTLAKHTRKPLQVIENKEQRPKSIASFCRVVAPAPRLINHNSRIAPVLFDTNKVHKIIILIRALMKTKEKQFSIRYKFALRPILRMSRDAGCIVRKPKSTGRIAFATPLEHPDAGYVDNLAGDVVGDGGGEEFNGGGYGF
jgi:hypothetical protein